MEWQSIKIVSKYFYKILDNDFYVWYIKVEGKKKGQSFNFYLNTKGGQKHVKAQL